MSLEMGATSAWLRLLRSLLLVENITSPRRQETQEIIGYSTRLDMRYPVVISPQRKLGYRFMAAEAAWILSGDNRVSSISPYSKEISRFSDDGVFFFGAYGPKVVDQLSYVISSLVGDISTRQAVINIWREKPAKTKDVPCTLSIQFLIRGNLLHAVVSMRSSDAWLGVPYDWFNFTMLSAAVALLYRDKTGTQLELGELNFHTGSQHLYAVNKEAARLVVNDNVEVGSMQFNYAKFSGFDELVKCLASESNKNQEYLFTELFS